MTSHNDGFAMLRKSLIFIRFVFGFPVQAEGFLGPARRMLYVSQLESPDNQLKPATALGYNRGMYIFELARISLITAPPFSTQIQLSKTVLTGAR